MITYEDQKGMKDCIDHVCYAIKERHEYSVSRFLKSYDDYRMAVAQEGRFDLLQDSLLGTDKIRATLGQEVRRAQINRNELYPEAIIRNVMKHVSLHGGLLSSLHNSYSGLHGDILAHYRDRPSAFASILRPSDIDSFEWLIKLMNEQAPNLLSDLLQFAEPYVEEMDYRVLKLYLPKLYEIDDDEFSLRFFERWETEIRKTLKDFTHYGAENMVRPENISLFERFASKALLKDFWHPELWCGNHVDFSIIKHQPLTLTGEQMGQWMASGSPISAFIYCLAIENDGFDLEALEWAIKDKLKPDRTWVVTSLAEAVSVTEALKPEKKDRLLEVMGVVTGSLMDRPWAEKLLYDLAEIGGQELVMQTDYGRRHADAFMSRDLGL